MFLVVEWELMWRNASNMVKCYHYNSLALKTSGFMLLSNIATQEFCHVSNQWKKCIFFGKKVTKLANNRRSQRKWFSLSFCSHSIKWYSASVPRHPPPTPPNLQHTHIHIHRLSSMHVFSLMCSIIVTSAEVTLTLCGSISDRASSFSPPCVF